MTTQNYDIWIDRGADFFLTLKCRDDSGNLIDLTDAEITAQLREYPEALDYKQFTTEHNGEGGQILLTMAHEDTADIGYTSGVYDVFVELSGGSMQKYITGDVTISPSVTRPVYGQIAYLLEFATEADFPPVGLTRRVYFSQATTKMYRWNGTAYVGYTNYYTKSETDALLSGKSDVGHNHDDRYYTETEVDNALALKANSADVYSKSDVDTALSAKEDIANLKALAYKDKADFYDDIDNLPSGYPPSPHNHDDRYYTEGEIDTALSGKSDVGHTHDYDDLTNKPTLGNLADHDTVDYETEITNLPTLGTMSAVNDAPSDGDEYVRKNGDWAVASGGGGSSAWGGITGDIDDQTDLKNALDAKADSADLGALAEKDTVDWDTDIDNIPNTFPPESHTHTMSDVTDLPTFGDLAEKDTVDWDTDIVDIPSTFSPSSHTHTTSDISNFPTLGTMASVNDATSDNTMYVRKNGAWVALPIYSGGIS